MAPGTKKKSLRQCLAGASLVPQRCLLTSSFANVLRDFGDFCNAVKERSVKKLIFCANCGDLLICGIDF